MYAPSVYAHAISGGVLLVSIVYFIMYSSQSMSKDAYQLLTIILLFSIAMGIHGISHIGLEYVYNFNPMYLFTGKQIEPYQPCPYRRHCNCPYMK